ncbi:MAG TPA: DivIVA domain-containing protein [Gemmatimonadaceae bacterium]|nr:DivIVA domain-containing protein [Gemmatimonadaceae bacterium]
MSPMNDEGFYLTPLDVRRYDFETAVRGYKKERVDHFRDQVADELERLTRLNADLEAKAKGFHEQLRAFRERDKALNDALISAQQLRAEMREQADREAGLILREARAEADRIVQAARDDIQRLTTELDGLERARRSYLTQLRTLVERQLADIDAAAASAPYTPAAGSHAISAPSAPSGNGAAERTPPGGSATAGPREPRPTSTTPTPAWLDSLVKE